MLVCATMDQKLFFPVREFRPRAVYCVALCSAFLFLFGWAQPKAIAQVTILHSFSDGTVPNDGARPAGGLIQAPDGNFYGVTISNASGTLPGTGRIFQMTPGASVTVLNVRGKGSFYTDPLLYDDGTLIGISHGEPPGNGSLFALTESPKGKWSKQIWFKFDRSVIKGLSGPNGNVILGPNRILYGTTIYGGRNNGGTAYRVNPKTQRLRVIHNFPFILTDSPATTLLLATDGNFYGGTNALGAAGEIFKMTPNGTVSTFYTFANEGVGLNGPLIEGSDGNFYGTAGGFVFKLTPGGTLTVLHTFGSGTDGSGPIGAVAQGANGNLYGLCLGGGTAGYGTIYEVSTDGSTYIVLHSFGDGSIQNDGQYPDGRLLLGADNNFYGVTESGGSAGKGTIFKVSP